MDKITRQVRIEHWTQIMNECLNSGMNKTEWCRANGISDKQFFYWQRILRKEAFATSTSKDLSVITDPADETSPQKISFAEISHSNKTGVCQKWIPSGYHPPERTGLCRDIQFRFSRTPVTYRRDLSC